MLDITAKDNEIVLGEKAQKAIEELKNLQLQIAEANQIEGEIKESLLKAMEEHGIKKFSNNTVTFTYVPKSKRVVADTKKMKEDNIFDDYCKSSTVKASVRITYND
mgnify:FL=1